jgi:hypothetical protein
MSSTKEPFKAFPNLESILETDAEKMIRDPNDLPIIDTEIINDIQINNSNNFTSEQVFLGSTESVIDEEYILPKLVDSTSEETSSNINNSIVHFDTNITIIKNDDYDIIHNEIDENDENNFFIKFLHEIYSNINSCYK